MRAVNPLPSSEVTSDKRPYEPSMEEILASIRRIIADDQSLPARGPASSASVDDAAVEDDGEGAQGGQVQDARIQERSRDQRRGGGKSNDRPAFHGSQSEPVRGAYSGASDSAPARGQERLEQTARTIEHPDHDVEEGEAFYETPVEPAISGTRAKPRETSAPRAAVPPLRDEPRETSPLFSASTDTAVQSAFNMLAASRLANSSDEIMTLAREMIRPLLRTWIDDNLPAMVERMVRAEIERVSRGGR